MWNHTENVIEHFYNPQNQGAIADPQEDIAVDKVENTLILPSLPLLPPDPLIL